jgi:hypothetical protein
MAMHKKLHKGSSFASGMLQGQKLVNEAVLIIVDGACGERFQL